MQVRHRTGLWKMKLGQRIVSVLAFCLSLGTTKAFAAPTFYSTTEPSQWLVATNLNQPDGLPSSFQTSTFTSAVLRDGTSNWIANVARGTNSPGGVGYWTFFVFRQIVSLTGYDPTTANLQFEWAADDSGHLVSSVLGEQDSASPAVGAYKRNRSDITPLRWGIFCLSVESSLAAFDLLQ